MSIGNMIKIVQTAAGQQACRTPFPPAVHTIKRVIFSLFFTELPIFGGYFAEWVDNKREIHYNLNIECYQIMAKMLQRNYDSVFRHFCLW